LLAFHEGVEVWWLLGRRCLAANTFRRVSRASNRFVILLNRKTSGPKSVTTETGSLEVS
jgi:hypothetical protein